MIHAYVLYSNKNKMSSITVSLLFTNDVSVMFEIVKCRIYTSNDLQYTVYDTVAYTMCNFTLSIKHAHIKNYI